MKTAELTGALLDRWVAKACGYPLDSDGDRLDVRESGGIPSAFHPSTDWAQGGPIIERERIDLIHVDHEGSEFGAESHWNASMEDDQWGKNGATLLVAAMRAFVASKFGDTVPDEAP